MTAPDLERLQARVQALRARGGAADAMKRQQKCWTQERWDRFWAWLDSGEGAFT